MTQPFRILSLDPSTSAVGWAFCNADGDFGRVRALITEAGVLKPKMTHKGKMIEGAERAIDLGFQLLDVVRPRLATAPIDAVIIETPGKGQSMRRRNHAASLRTYAWGGGTIAGMVATLVDRGRVRFVESDVWTRSGPRQVSKVERSIEAGHRFAAYDVALDDGGDQADAICLAGWFAAVRFHWGVKA